MAATGAESVDLSVQEQALRVAGERERKIQVEIYKIEQVSKRVSMPFPISYYYGMCQVLIMVYFSNWFFRHSSSKNELKRERARWVGKEVGV